MNTIEIECHTCKILFSKELREYKRQNKKHNNEAKFFCSKKCHNILLINNGAKHLYKYCKINYELYLKDKVLIRVLDEYSLFRGFIRGAKTRSKKNKYEFDLTLEYLKRLWEDQKGTCPLTGVELIMAKALGKEKNKGPNPYNASLDRIDSSKGYIQRKCKVYSIYG